MSNIIYSNTSNSKPCYKITRKKKLRKIVCIGVSSMYMIPKKKEKKLDVVMLTHVLVNNIYLMPLGKFCKHVKEKKIVT